MKKITESELNDKVNRLKEYLKVYENQQVDEWSVFDPRTWGNGRGYEGVFKGTSRDDARAQDAAKNSTAGANMALVQNREQLAPGSVASETGSDGVTYAVDEKGMRTFKIENGKWVAMPTPTPSEQPELAGAPEPEKVDAAAPPAPDDQGAKVEPVPEPSKIDATPLPAARTYPTTNPEIAKATRALATANGIKISPTGMAIIKPGQEIKLSDGTPYTVAPGDNLWSIAAGKFKGTEPPVSAPASAPASAPETNTTGLNAPKLKTGTGPTEIPSGAPAAPAAPAAEKKSADAPKTRGFSSQGMTSDTYEESVEHGYSEDQTLARIIQLARK